MTIRLEEIVYLHCHQQGKARAGAAGGCVTLALDASPLGSAQRSALAPGQDAQSSGWPL